MEKKSWLSLVAVTIVLITIFLIYTGFHGWDFKYFFDKAKNSTIGTIISLIVATIVAVIYAVLIPVLKDKYYNLSIIEKFEQRLEISNDMKPLPYEEN